MKTASWILRNKETKVVICETFDARKVAALNTVKYEAVPILEYLQSINGRKYHLVTINERSGHKTQVTGYPMSHAECCTMKSKMTEHPARRIQLEEVAA